MAESPHTGDIIGNAILESLKEWNIVDEVLSLTPDNASNLATTSFLCHYLESPLA
ncbi:unnamed protein product, partial [Citrullus colocynthis]